MFHSFAKKWPVKGNGFLFLVFLLAISFRILILIHYRHAISFDESHFIRLAGNFSEKGIRGVLHPYWPFLYPFLISFFNLLIGNLELSARILNVLSGAFLPVLIYWLTDELFGKKEARLAAILVALHPILVYNNTNALTETLYSAAAIGGILVGWKALKTHKIKWMCMTGILFGGSYLFRPEGVGFLVVFLGFLTIQVILKKIKLLIGTKMLIAIILGFIIVSSPYFLYLKKSTGKWTLSTKGMVNQQMESAVYFNEGEIKDPFFHLTEDNQYLPYDMALHFGNIQELTKLHEGHQRIVHISIGKYLKKYFMNMSQLFRKTIPEFITLTLLIMLIIGFFTKSYSLDQWWFVSYLVAYFIFFWCLLIPLFHVNQRYLYPLFPLLFIWISKGCWFLYGWILDNIREIFKFKKMPNSKRNAIVIISCIVFVGFIPGWVKLLLIQPDNTGMWTEPVELKRAGLWLKENTSHPPVLMSLNKAVDYYAGQYDMRKGASFSYDSLNRNLEYAHHRGVEFIVVDSRYLDWFPNLKPFFEINGEKKELELVYKDNRPLGIQTLIYRLIYKNK